MIDLEVVRIVTEVAEAREKYEESCAETAAGQWKGDTICPYIAWKTKGGYQTLS